jgi:UDP-N-acetylglucosamine transferase subunit ALG13
VVVPRLARYGEHVDDHQLQITKALACRGAVAACLPDDDIEACIARARAAEARVGPDGDLARALAEATNRDHPGTRRRAFPLNPGGLSQRN